MAAAPAETPKKVVQKQSKLAKLLDLRRHTDHKLMGIAYVIGFTLTVYFMLSDIDYYESTITYHIMVPLIGCLVSLSALRNFRFLPKSAENPGMFAKNRTFSYAFLKENLWFQLLLGMTFIGGHPMSSQYLSNAAMSICLFSLFVIRELVPKTSYSSWEVGNNKVNSRFNGWVSFINFQVKIVRWNYVFKKTYLLYLFILFQAEHFLNLGESAAFVSQSDRILFYLLCLDAMHNITTAFFFQTLKFKGFISAETFAILFNASPLFGIYLTYKLVMSHTIVIPFAVALALDLYINLEFIYPSKYSFVWKNRLQILCKTLCVAAASLYIKQQ